MMPRARSPFDQSKYEGDSRRERSMSISSRNSSSEREHSPIPYKKRRPENYERYSRDREKSVRSARSLYRQDERKSIGSDYSGSDYDDFRDSMLDMEESVDPSICNFRGSSLQDDILEHRKSSGKDRLKRLETIMAKVVQNGRTPSEQSGMRYGSEEHDRGPSNSRLKNLEKMIEKMIKNKTETSTFTAPTEPSGELIPRNSNFTTSMWLSMINEECLERGYDEKTCIKFLESKMTGSVKSWYKNFGPNDLTWPELKMLITQTFPDNSEFASTLRLLVNRFKKPEETITQYYFSKMYLIEACRISGVFAVSCLIDGLKDPKIQREAKANNFLTPESLYSHFLDKLPNHVEPNHKDEMDRPNHKGRMDWPSHPNKQEKEHKGQLNSPNSEMEHPNHPNVDNSFKFERPKSLNYQNGQPVLPNSGMEHPNHPNDDPGFKFERPNSPNHGKGQPFLPNYSSGQPNFSDEFLIGRSSQQNFNPDFDFGMEQPHPSNFGMGQPHPSNFGMGQPHPSNFGMGQPHPSNFGMGQPHPNFGMGPPHPPNFGMGQPHPPNFGMGLNYGMGPWQPPYFDEPSSGYQDERPKCTKCSKMGHWPKDCWTKCYICSEKGHVASSCPKKDVLDKKQDKKPNKKLEKKLDKKLEKKLIKTPEKTPDKKRK